MSALEQYILAMEALEDEGITASGLAALVIQASGTGTCGVVTAANGIPLPLPEITGTGDWLPAANCALPSPGAMATTDGWRPAWGGDGLPLPEVAAQGSIARKAQAALPPLFGLARAGAWGEVLLPAGQVAAAYNTNRTGDAACALPAPAALAFACGLDSPVTNHPGSAAVVDLLCQGDPALAALAASLGGGETDADALAGAMLAIVAQRLAYVDDDDDTDIWTCALGTYFRETGDCEDGAILLHALLLAAGLPADRLVTAFGRVGIDRTGHAWLGYRRVCDGQWAALDWTLGPSQAPVPGLPVLGESAYYAVVDYALTASAFFTVRQDAAVFFARALADAVLLPAWSLAADAAHGGRAVLDVPSGWATCLGRTGSGGTCRLARPGVAATAGSVRASVSMPTPSLDGAGGGRAALSPALPEATGQAGGGGKAACALGRIQGAGEVRTGVLVAATVSLTAWRSAGAGRAGKVGTAGCLLPRPRLLAKGLPGVLAPGGLALPVPDCRGDGRERALVAALIAAAALGACGRGRPGEAVLTACPYDAAVGEECS